MVMWLWKAEGKWPSAKWAFHEECIFLVFSTTWRIFSGVIFVSRIQASAAKEKKQAGEGHRSSKPAHMGLPLAFKNWACVPLYWLCPRVMISQNVIVPITVLCRLSSGTYKGEERCDYSRICHDTVCSVGLPVCWVGILPTPSFFFSWPIHPIVPKKLTAHVYYINIFKTYIYNTIIVYFVFYKPIKMRTKIEASVYFSHTLMDYLVSTFLLWNPPLKA